MSIESQIYTRLSSNTNLAAIVGSKIYPTEPTENTALPFVVYGISGSEDNLTFDGSSGLTKYNLEINVYAINLASVLSILSEVKTSLNCYRGGNIQGSFLQSQQTTQLEDGYNGQASYSVNASTGNVTATIDSTGTVVTGLNSVTLTACGHSLVLNCDGLSLDGGEVGASPDLTNYATKNANNNFSASQTITGTVTATSFTGLASGLTSIPAGNLTGSINDARLSSNVALLNTVNTFTATQTLNSSSGTQAVIKAYTGQTSNILEVQNSSGTVKAYISPNIVGTGLDNYYFALKPGTREYRIGSWDAAGAMLFARSDSGNALQFQPDASKVRLNCTSGDMYITGSSSGKLYLAGNEGGGAVDIMLGCRYSDSSSGVGANVKIWTSTGQSTYPLSVLAPGGGSSLWSVDAKGGIVPASMADSAANNGTIYYSTTQSKMVFKDSSGTVNNLY